MKAIELTEEHKNKLLEMCKVLFPEYFYWKLSKKQFILAHIRGNDPEIYKGEKPNFKIHWFEFCTIFIMEKLQRNGGGEDFSNYMNICFNYNFPDWDIKNKRVHPIDYLYEEFLKLK